MAVATLTDHFRFGHISRELQPWRSEYDRDYERVLHSPSLRRLAHKTQLFPSRENDFFRTRLTHSLEVAQIAAEIGRKLQLELAQKQASSAAEPADIFKIEPRVCEVAGLVHDLGHPPFGHKGEKALNRCMQGAGGFEGNAQTMHILMRLERTEERTSIPENMADSDTRIGLNLTARSLASALKHDRVIPIEAGPPSSKEQPRVIKGYYEADAALVDTVKSKLAPDVPAGQFKTIECAIMDIADDIAYATCDLEDAFAGGFLTPLTLLTQGDDVFENIAAALSGEYQQLYGCSLSGADCAAVVRDLFDSVFGHFERVVSGPPYTEEEALQIALYVHSQSDRFATAENCRTEQTSSMIDEFIKCVSLKYNKENPLLSGIEVEPAAWLTINVLKQLNYRLIITSPMLQVAEYRGEEIVVQLFDGIYKRGGQLLPTPYREIYEAGSTLPDLQRVLWEKRVVCDFVSSMSDRSAVEFHRHLYSSDGASIFKPL